MHSKTLMASALCLASFATVQAQKISTSSRTSAETHLSIPMPELPPVWLFGPAGAVTRTGEEVENPVKDSLETCLINEQYALQQLLHRPADQCEREWVAVNDDTYIDVKWLTMEDYFAIWDSQNLNSYNYDLKNFREPVDFQLYDKHSGEYWHLPVESSKINSKYGVRRYRWHHGVDIDLEIGDPIYATFDGIVRISKYNKGGYGNYVLLRHKNGFETLYGHLDEAIVQEGQEVKAGTLIGFGGNTGRSTGPHLHFEVRYRGHSFNPSYIFKFTEGDIVGQHFTLTPDHYSDMVERSESKYHRIRKGETLGHIASKYGTRVSTICRLNGISTKTVLRVGRSLRVR